MIDIFYTDFIIFNVAGVGVSLIEFLSVCFGLTCVLLAGMGKVYNFWIGYIYGALLFFLFYQKGLYSSMIIQPVSMVISIIGHYRWSHPKPKEANDDNELKVSKLITRERLMFLCIIVLFTIIWGMCMNAMTILWPNYFVAPTRPFLDSFVVAFILTAQYLSAYKKIDCWGAWLVVNTTNIILYILAGMVFMPIVSSAYLVLAFFGYASWHKQMKQYQDA